MAVTPNYSWVTPAPTDLVTDLPADFEIFADAVDATVFSNAGAAINKTIIDAAGDLIYGTAADTAARLALGTANQVLTVNSGATAPEWKTPAGGGKVLQVVSAVDSTQTTTTSGTFVTTGLSATITLADNTNKVLILCTVPARSDGNNSVTESASRFALRYTNTTTDLVTNDLTVKTANGSPEIGSTIAFAYLHSPASTSALTYEIFMRQLLPATNVTAIQAAGASMVLLEIEA